MDRQKSGLKKPVILVTGGLGYIGSHTICALLEKGYAVVCLDNGSRSNSFAPQLIRAITGEDFTSLTVDLCNASATRSAFEGLRQVDGIIHFAAYKLVGESVREPLLYYQNNLCSLLNLLQAAKEFDVKNLVFSSSCTVYGNPEKLPVKEESPVLPAASPYGKTKQIAETILEEMKQDFNVVSLRYFNPIGAHPSGKLGEWPEGQTENLMPRLLGAVSGALPALSVFGTDYPTRDGSCIRDYVDVMDLANGHLLAMSFLKQSVVKTGYQVFNLGSGIGTSVLELLSAFEKATGMAVPHQLAARRPGDVPAIFSDYSLAESLLGWRPQTDCATSLHNAWKWEQFYRLNLVTSKKESL